MIGYKGFDKKFTCRGFQYEIGKTYEMDGKIELCERGFHFCEYIPDCFAYYPPSSFARYAKIEAIGDVIRRDNDNKCVTNKIRILEEIPRDEAIKMSNTGICNSGECNSGECNSGECNSGFYNSGSYNSGSKNSGGYNSGYYNSGDWNTGNGNTGNWNTGHCNSGSYNSGDRNSGDWNKSSFNNGCFMTVNPVIMMFNKPTSWTFDDWFDSRARAVMTDCPTDCTYTGWVPSSQMTDEEREAHPEHKTLGGYLKMINRKGDRQAWWDGLSADDKQTVMSLPNFDADVFYECTGIRVTEDANE